MESWLRACAEGSYSNSENSHEMVCSNISALSNRMLSAISTSRKAVKDA